MIRISRLMLLGALVACLCAAATTAVWEIDGYQDFLRGRMSGLSITPDGRLVLGPKLDTFFTSDQPQIWSVAQAPDGSLYLGTGNRGRLMKVDAAGKGSVAWSADQPEIFAVAVDRAGVVYAGTSPDGKVYRIENGKATEYFAPGERYIWALAFAPDGALFVATGQQGKIFRVTAAGRGDVSYETGQAAAGRQRAQRHSVPHHRLSRLPREGLRAVRRESAGNPHHRAAGRRLDLRVCSRRQCGAAHRRGFWSGAIDRRDAGRASHEHHGHRRAGRPQPEPQT
jgi:hypothetical protein